MVAVRFNNDSASGDSGMIKQLFEIKIYKSLEDLIELLQYLINDQTTFEVISVVILDLRILNKLINRLRIKAYL